MSKHSFPLEGVEEPRKGRDIPRGSTPRGHAVAYGDYRGGVEFWMPRESDKGCVDIDGDGTRWVAVTVEMHDLERLVATKKLEQLTSILESVTLEEFVSGEVQVSITRNGVPIKYGEDD